MQRGVVDDRSMIYQATIADIHSFTKNPNWTLDVRKEKVRKFTSIM